MPLGSTLCGAIPRAPATLPCPCWQQLRARRPNLKALYISGYSGEAVQPDAARVWKNFLQKPFTMEVFARKVREVLSDPGRPAR